MDTDQHLQASLKARQTHLQRNTYWVHSLKLEGGLHGIQPDVDALIALLTDIGAPTPPMDPTDYTLDEDALRSTITSLSHLLSLMRHA